METLPRIIGEHKDEEMTMDILRHTSHVVDRIIFACHKAKSVRDEDVRVDGFSTHFA
jgi:hypothetical protein